MRTRANAVGVVSVLVVLSSPGVVVAGSIAGNGGATEITQLLNNTESLQQTMLQMQQVQQGIQQVNQMIRDAQRLTSDPLGLSQIVGVYNNVVGEVKSMQNLAYGTVNAVENFKFVHPDFNPSRAYNPDDYIRRTKTTMQTIQNAIQSGASTVVRAETEQARIEELGKKVNTVDGTTQMLQTANAVQYEVLQQLRSTQMYQKTVNDAQLSYIAGQQSNLDEKKTANTSAFRNLNRSRLTN